MRFSEATGHKIVSTSTAATIGRVDGFVVDPAHRTVLALQVGKADSGDTLARATTSARSPMSSSMARPVL